MIINPNNRMHLLWIIPVIAILIIAGCTKDQASKPSVDNGKSTHSATVDVLVGADAKQTRKIEPAGEIWDIVWDDKENSIITLGTRNDQWIFQVFRNNNPSAKELRLDEGWLPGSRIFYYHGQPSIIAGRDGDIHPALYVIGSQLKRDPTFDQGRDTDSTIDGAMAKSRRALLTKLKADRPTFEQNVVDNKQHGSLTNEALSWSTFPIIVGHPVLPIVSFSQNKQCIAVLDDNIAIYKKTGGRWTGLSYTGRRDSSWPVGGDIPISSDITDARLVLGFKHKTASSQVFYETRELMLTDKNWTARKPIKGLIASPRSQREY